jgi:DNA polymerase I-like protein with 3'-5' exonuclease and polymerase domains
MSYYALDIETAPINPPNEKQAWALEPYSCGTRSKITSVAVTDGTRAIQILEADMHRLPALLAKLAGQRVFAANAIFDVAFMYKHLLNMNLDNAYELIRNVKWADIQILGKTLQNGEDHRHTSYSLVECAKVWGSDFPRISEFLAMKEETHTAGEDEDYWEHRGLEDAEITLWIARNMMKQLPKSCFNSYINMSASIAPLARGYVRGIDVDISIIDTYAVTLKERIAEGLKELGIEQATLASPKKLGNLLFGEWGLTPHSLSAKTGAPSTAEGDLVQIYFKQADDRLYKLLEVKKLMTIQSKYVKGFKGAVEYLNEPIIHGNPRIFAAATSRMSYSSSIKKKYKTSISLHQIPSSKESKPIKKALVSGEGNGFVYFDITNQEMVLASYVSNDGVLIEAFNNGQSLHSLLASKIFGIPYAVIEEANATGEPEELVKYRQNAKLVNLSSLYRIGNKSLREKFLEKYRVQESEDNIASYARAYKSTYQGIVDYWESQIISTRKKGYTETLGGLRYYTKGTDWAGEQSAINIPIQGSAGDILYFLISELDRVFPEYEIVVLVHDSFTLRVPASTDEELKYHATRISDFINNTVDFNRLFGYELPVRLSADFKYGYNYGEMTPLKRG